MKKTYLWMSVTILCSSLMMTSCVDQTDNPVEPSENESASAKDPGKWWINESYMDKSVKPGDNFFMYCVGTWWKKTDIDPEMGYTDRQLPKPPFSERVNSAVNTDANYGKFKSHLLWADSVSEAAASAQKLYDNALKQSGLDAATTREDVLEAFGKMSALGVSPLFRLDPFCRDGKVCLYAHFEDDIFTDEVNASNNASRSAGRPSFLQMVNEHPELLTHLVPVSGTSATRGTVTSEWSLATYILKGMGIDAKSVFVYDDFLKAYDAFKENDERVKVVRETFQQWQQAFDDNDVEKLKAGIMTYYSTDYCLISSKTMEDTNQMLVDEYNKSKDKDAKLYLLNLDKIKQTLDDQYLPYLRSKIVADKLVPAGLKEEYLKNCEEIKAVFAQRISDNEWMSDGSKQNALDKLNAMVFNVGYPDHWYQEGLPDFSKSESLLEDVYIMRKARLELLKKIVGKTREQESFTVFSMLKDNNLAIENAFYFINFNAMTIFPYCILPPYYDPLQSLAINYEGYRILAHEITHGFDNDGIKFDKKGDLTANGIWASEADKAEFERRAELLVKCYESYDVLPDEMPGVKAVGRGTLPENIADLGGAEIAWQAYANRLKADGYTGDQLKLMQQRFFLALGEEFRSKYGKEHFDYMALGINNPNGPDGHSLPKERVNGVVANMNSWYEAFDIKDGALYRAPADRIKIW